MKIQKGFTLIELLIVIAIIGILAAIVLVNVNSARNRAKDASIKANLSTMILAAEQIYDSVNPNSYATVCDAGTPSRSAFDEANKQGDNNGLCYPTATSYVACVKLNNPEDGNKPYFCVDQSGVKTQVATCTGTPTKCADL